MTLAPSNAKTLTIHLIDGVSSGSITAEINHRWNGKIFVVPFTRIAELATELNAVGVYTLCGDNPEEGPEKVVYVGQTTNVSARLKQHADDEKLPWSVAIAIVSKDSSLNTAHALYLERRLYDTVRESGTTRVYNSNLPPGNPLSKPEQADMEYYLEQIKLLLPVLGFRFLEPPLGASLAKAKIKSTLDSIPTTDNPLELHITGPDAEARAIVYNDQYVVLKGSIARKQPTPTAQYKGLRQNLMATGKLIDDPKASTRLIFAEDVAFDSASAAAGIVLGRAVAGPREWTVVSTQQDYLTYLNSLIRSSEVSGHEGKDTVEV